jgi:dUTP pyrophosphatase
MMNKEDMEYVNSKISELQKMLNIDEDDEIMDYNSLFEEYGVNIEQLEEDMKETSTKIELGYKVLSNYTISPFYNYPTDSGFDLYSTEDVEIDAFGRALIPTGLSFDIPSGYEIQVRSKSGLAINQGLMVLNSPGTVDAGFSGEVKVILFNTNKEPFTITKGMKVSQAVLSPVAAGKWVELIKKDTINNKDRNSNGFGSTGI